MSFPEHNHVGEPLLCIDDVTSCGDVSSGAVYSWDCEVRNNLMTKQMLNTEYFKLKHLAKVS